MSDTINALTQAARSSSILDAIAHPAVVNPLAAMNAGDAACMTEPRRACHVARAMARGGMACDPPR
jgi:hypothetical protein